MFYLFIYLYYKLCYFNTKKYQSTQNIQITTHYVKLTFEYIKKSLQKF